MGGAAFSYLWQRHGQTSSSTTLNSPLVLAASPQQCQSRPSLSSLSCLHSGASAPLAQAQSELQAVLAKSLDTKFNKSIERVIRLIAKGSVETDYVLADAQLTGDNREAGVWLQHLFSEKSRLSYKRPFRRRRSGMYFIPREDSTLLSNFALSLGHEDGADQALSEAEDNLVRAADKRGQNSSEYGVALVSRGTARALLGRHEDAVHDFSQAIAIVDGKCSDEELSALAATAWHQKATSLCDLGKLEGAVLDCERAFCIRAPQVHRTCIATHVNLALKCSEDWELFDAEFLDTVSQGRPISTYAAHAFGVRPFGRESASIDGIPGLLARISDDNTVTQEQAQALSAFTLILDVEYAACQLGNHASLGKRTRETDRMLGGLGNPYHNRLHGVDVMQATNLISRNVTIYNAFDDVVSVAVLFAAMVHDFRHPGYNERFLIQTNHPLTIRYSDDSTLERMHLAEVFELLAKPGCDWLRVSDEIRCGIRELVIHCVLGTDLVRSAHHIGIFKGHVENESNFATNVPATLSLACMVVKLADVSHPARTRKTHLMWSRRILSEFFHQGEQEAKAGLPVSPLCNAEGLDIAKSQSGFIDLVTRPILNVVHDFCLSNHEAAQPDVARHTAPTPVLANNISIAKRLLDDNYAYWKSPDCANVERDLKSMDRKSVLKTRIQSLI